MHEMMKSGSERRTWKVLQSWKTLSQADQIICIRPNISDLIGTGPCTQGDQPDGADRYG